MLTERRLRAQVTLRAESEEDMRDWVEEIRLAMQAKTAPCTA